MSAVELRLRALPAAVRFGLSGVVLTLAGGLAASLGYMQHHHENRDGREGVSLDDIRGAYTGVENRAALLTALERGHPADLPIGEKERLLGWLEGGRVSEDYDDLDLGDDAPAELLQRRCISCHSRSSEDPIGETVPLEYWDDVERVAFSRSLEATPTEILMISTHTHALALGTLTALVILLLQATRCSAWLRGATAWVGGTALFLDLASWWIARLVPAFVFVIVAAGAAWAASMAFGLLAILWDLWWPDRSRS